MFQFHFLLPEFSALDNVMLPMRALARSTSRTMQARAPGSARARSGLPITPTSCPASCPAASASASRSRARLPTIPRSSWPTSRPATSTRHPSEQVLAIFRKLVDETGRAIVMVTHDLDLAARADRHVRIVDGRIE